MEHIKQEDFSNTQKAAYQAPTLISLSAKERTEGGALANNAEVTGTQAIS